MTARAIPGENICLINGTNRDFYERESDRMRVIPIQDCNSIIEKEHLRPKRTIPVSDWNQWAWKCSGTDRLKPKWSPASNPNADLAHVHPVTRPAVSDASELDDNNAGKFDRLTEAVLRPVSAQQRMRLQPARQRVVPNACPRKKRRRPPCQAHQDKRGAGRSGTDQRSRFLESLARPKSNAQEKRS